MTKTFYYLLRYKLISVIYLAFIMSNPYLLSPNYPNQPSLSSRALRRTTKSMIPPSAGQFGLIYKGSIRSSQKLIIFYPKLFRKIVLSEPLDSPSHLGRGRGLGQEGGFDLDSFRSCAAATLRSGRVASPSVPRTATARRCETASHHCPLRRHDRRPKV